MHNNLCWGIFLFCKKRVEVQVLLFKQRSRLGSVNWSRRRVYWWQRQILRSHFILEAKLRYPKDCIMGLSPTNSSQEDAIMTSNQTTSTRLQHSSRETDMPLQRKQDIHVEPKINKALWRKKRFSRGKNARRSCIVL